MPIYTPGKVTLAKGQPVPNDPNFAFNSLLLHGNGTNGSTVITDSSGSPKAVVAVGNAQISTAESKPGFGGASIVFDGNGDYLSTPTRSDFVFGIDNFTIELWAWKSADGVNSFDSVINSDATTGATSGQALSGFALELSSARGLVFYANNSLLASYNFNPNDSQWRHYAVSRNGNQLRLFTDGVLRTTVTNATNLLADHGIRIGSVGNLSGVNAFWFNGYIDDFRITKGIARYTANFTPPTLPFPDF